MFTVNKNQIMAATGTKLIAEASTLRLPPICWPEFIAGIFALLALAIGG